MRKNLVSLAVAGVVSISGIAPLALAQSLDLTINDVGLSIGDSRRVTGLRLNFRDRELRRVDGANVTLWAPYEHPRGLVNGLALGLPLTGARRIEGLGAGIFGVAADETIRGVGIGGIGLGAGEDIVGLAVGGIGMGVGRDIRGIAIGGIGAGAGRDIEGLAIGGIGMGVGEDLHGIALGGIGMGVGQNLRGLAAGGIGVGVGGNAKGALIGGIGAGVGGDMVGLSVGGIGIGVGGSVKGVTIGGIGMGIGGDATGLQVAGIGIGTGGTLKWVSIAGVGIGASRIQGVAIASAVGAEQVRGFVLAPAYFRISKYGRMNGLNVSAFNDVRGIQQGVAIGIFNSARVLDGLQIGLLNYAKNKPKATRLLPFINFARAR